MTNLTAADVDALLDGLTNCILTRPELAQRLRGPQGDQGPGTTRSSVQVVDTRWRMKECVLFEPDLQIDERNPPGDVLTVRKGSIYRNVDSFCQRSKDVIATKGAETVRDNILLCLRGAANRWWTFRGLRNR